MEKEEQATGVLRMESSLLRRCLSSTRNTSKANFSTLSVIAASQGTGYGGVQRLWIQCMALDPVVIRPESRAS